MGLQDAVTLSDHRARASTLRSALLGRSVYQIGLNTRPVTIYSQQARALRLADALAASHANRPEKRTICVVGTGIAGMTFANAYKSLAHGDRVVMIKAPTATLFGPQRRSARYIHPHLYSWPSPGWQERRATIPFFPWDADSAQQVVKQWDGHHAHLEQHLEIEVVEDTVNGFLPASDGHRYPSLEQVNGVVVPRFDLIVFATGFGPDKSYPKPPGFVADWLEVLEFSYWNEVPASCLDLHQIAVVGGGDGAIIDALRLRLGEDYQRTLAETDWQLPAENLPLIEGYLNEPNMHLGPFQWVDTLGVEKVLDNLLPVEADTPEVFVFPGESGFSTATLLNRLLIAYALSKDLITNDSGFDNLDPDSFAGLQDTRVGRNPGGARTNGLLWRIGPDSDDLREQIISQVDERGALIDIESLRSFRRVEHYELGRLMPSAT